MAKPDNRLPLYALLSKALVAFVIELDNEFEHQMPHWTTDYGPKAGRREGPWLVSAAMWSNCMQHLGEQGISVTELKRLARTGTNLRGMARWGYVKVDKELRDDPIVRPTAKGREAQKVWRPLFDTIEHRWKTRYGVNDVDELRKHFENWVSRFEADLPDCLPILKYGLFSTSRGRKKNVERAQKRESASKLPLSALFSRPLLVCAALFERKSNISLACYANVLRILNVEGLKVRDLPRLSGVSKEAISMALGVLKKMELVVEESEARSRIVGLTSEGKEAQGECNRLLDEIEAALEERFSKELLGAVHESLEKMVGAPLSENASLSEGIKPYADGWRASVPKPITLPHFPTVLHRGGFPDGS